MYMDNANQGAFKNTTDLAFCASLFVVSREVERTEWCIKAQSLPGASEVLS